ncbi:hypothetical protein [Methanolobus profundi]|uniref:S-layer family duplication domain-containing protein n=1 Tax=Methanolobus profundi TaxID=487685 RepID=A0A1I4QQY7_9EURY|nr:hypothetical protein [Methanolobus profundi]SFM42492.1 hypothetical protein SAMN04488696_1155 [Methanolobus profundi]
MKYIHFVIVCVCLFVLCISPAAGVRTEAMIHYSEPAVAVGDELFLEQGYSFKVVDMNTRSGAIMIELYLNGEEIDLDDTLAKEDEPLEYVRTVVEDEDDEDEIDYFILRITPKGSVKESDDVYRSTVYIEQYLDPMEDVGDYLILDKSFSFDDDSELELAGLYTLKVMDVEDGEISLELRLNGGLLKQDDLEEENYFYYTVYSDEQPDVIFLAYLETFFESDDEVTVFLKHVSLKQSTTSDNDDEVPDEVDIDVESPVDGGLKAGRAAIINYYVDDSFSEVRILVDGDVIDTRKDVDAGVYKAVTDELGAGVHKATLIMMDDDDDFISYSEEFSVSVNIKENITESLAGFASSAAESLSKDNSSSGNDSSSLSVPSLPSGSSISNAVSFIITAGVFILFFMFFKKFR